jgi:hypothetical protein
MGSAVSSSGGGASFTPLTAADLTVANSGSNGAPFVATWTWASLAGLAGSDGTRKVCTLPAKTVVRKAYLIVTGNDASALATTFTVSLGRTGAGYTDYVLASSYASAATVGTVYGNASAERGANLTGGDVDLPSWSATTDVYVHFITTGGTLNDLVDGSEVGGTIIIEYEAVP